MTARRRGGELALARRFAVAASAHLPSLLARLQVDGEGRRTKLLGIEREAERRSVGCTIIEERGRLGNGGGETEQCARGASTNALLRWCARSLHILVSVSLLAQCSQRPLVKDADLS